MSDTRADAEGQRLQPYGENPRYWQYHGQPVLLLGGSSDDNLFQVLRVEAELDLLVAQDGNEVRNTMSDRNDLGYEVKAFAGSRFHRPPWGLGLGPDARRHLRVARRVTEGFDFFRADPDSDHRLLRQRQTNEAYLTRVEGEQYAIYYVDGGLVEVDLSGDGGPFRLTWFDIDGEREHDAGPVDGDRWVTLAAPGSGPWVALLIRA